MTFKDRGDFDLMTVDGLLDHLAHCEDEVVSGVRDGLNAWERAAHERETHWCEGSGGLTPWPKSECGKCKEIVNPT